MATTADLILSSSQIEVLIKGNQKLNRTLEELLAAVNSISDKLEGIEANKVIHPQALDFMTNRSEDAQTLRDADESNQILRPHGYVNWTKKHDVIKNQKWIEVTHFRRYCDIIKNGRRNSEKIDDSFYSHVVNEVKRFPQGFLYLDVTNPQVATEILCASYAELSRSDNDIKCVLNSLKNFMHTRSSFEQKYGLKWVDPIDVDVDEIGS